MTVRIQTQVWIEGRDENVASKNEAGEVVA